MNERPAFINPNLEFKYISSGRRSDVFDLGDYALKTLKHLGIATDTQQLAKSFRDQYLILKEVMGDYVVKTDFVIGNQNSQPSVFIVQPDTHGVPIKKLSREELKTPYILDFFRRSLKVYEKKGNMPDIFGRPHVVRWYTHPNTTPNVIVSTKDNLPFPNLVDILFTRNSQKPIIGRPHARFLYEGTRRLLNQLEK